MAYRLSGYDFWEDTFKTLKEAKECALNQDNEVIITNTKNGIVYRFHNWNYIREDLIEKIIKIDEAKNKKIQLMEMKKQAFFHKKEIEFFNSLYKHIKDKELNLKYSVMYSENIKHFLFKQFEFSWKNKYKLEDFLELLDRKFMFFIHSAFQHKTSLKTETIPIFEMGNINPVSRFRVDEVYFCEICNSYLS